jgi:hypothetical protein
MTSELLNQIGLILGITGSIFLAFSAKIGVISEGGQIIFTGLDPMQSSEKNKKIVTNSHWRNRFFTPIGWTMLAFAFFAQFVSTLDLLC